MAELVAKSSTTDTQSNSQWKYQHNKAIHEALSDYSESNRETGVVRMLVGWQEYARDHKTRFESAIGEDYILGVAWQEIGEALRTLLNGETGRLDCGTVDGFILDTMTENGIDTEKM
jgi:hypothetical protein